MLVALFALVLSMGGGAALAAKHYLISSTSQISPKVLTKLKGKTGPQGKTGLQGSQGLQGPQGIKGDAGANGTNGINGTNGVAIVQRTTGSATPGDDAGDPANTTLSNASFSNPAANTDNLFFAKATFTPPTTCTLSHPSEENAFVGAGGQVDSNTQIFGGGGPFTPGEPANIMQLGIASAAALGAGPHTLTLDFHTNCSGSGQHGSITNIVIDTATVG
jgi:hypothetical protein